ncbi:MAG: hypothetical protein CFH41_00701 [Alphaproteobacteria bacterium MarineAlpha11_Bin1]|nr:MAG: hypothetical protein CFH41_00701 [Alphaproteobacteria bacterium MarineAlpha11_Bin1]|tara:strand:- start:4940 stop:5203 length:264 start_codon:yes stop_codon:yes gene_type:complete
MSRTPENIAEEFIIPARYGKAFEVKKSQTFRIRQIDGKQGVDCVFYNAHNNREWWYCGQSWAINVICGIGTSKYSDIFIPSRPAKIS